MKKHKLFTSRVIVAFMVIAISTVFTHTTMGKSAKSRSYVERVFSKSMGDSITVFVQLPLNYKQEEKKRYPVVYMLDANFYFDMIGPILLKYEEVGMLPPLILVGIGYKDLVQMDSLRDRDYTFPVALPKYGMNNNTGNGQKFLTYINTELLPSIDKRFHTDTTKRILAGHSLGGFFTIYALWQNLALRKPLFSHYIAGSPSIHFNDYYLLDRLRSLSGGGERISLYASFGGNMEDSEESDVPDILKGADALSKLSQAIKPCGVSCTTVLFCNLAHMDTPIPTFIKGLQQAFK